MKKLSFTNGFIMAFIAVSLIFLTGCGRKPTTLSPPDPKTATYPQTYPLNP